VSGQPDRLTAYERDQLTMARQIVDELNASLAGRGSPVMFAVTTTRSGPVADEGREITETCGAGGD
jgi:hypothetical protein